MSIYDEHMAAKSKLDFWKKKELELRNEILESMSGEKDEGVVTLDEKEFQIKATYVMNRVIIKDVFDSVYNKLSDEEKECIKFKPEVVLKNFRKLEDKGESALLDAVTLKPGQGSIKIKYLG